MLYLLFSWIIAVFKECMIKGRKSKLYQKWKNCIRSGKIVSEVEKCFQVEKDLFYISKLNNAIYMLGVPSLHHKHHHGPCSYGSWIYNYQCNQCLSPLMLWVRISIEAISDTVCQWLATGRWFSLGPPPIKLIATI